MDYKELEELNKAKKNINQTYHLQAHEGHLPTVAWETSLREAPSKKKLKKAGDETAEQK